MGPSNRDKTSMIAAVLLDALERREASRSGAKLPDVRKAIARKIGEAPGTVENIRRGRLKRLVEGTADKIRAALIRSLEAEIAHLTHQVEVLRQCGSRPDSDEIFEAERLLQRAKELIGG